jgi:hypothetical protein
MEAQIAAIEAHIGAMKAHSGAAALHEAIKAHPEAMETQEDYPGILKIPWSLEGSPVDYVYPWRLSGIVRLTLSPLKTNRNEVYFQDSVINSEHKLIM